jgi:hypothetical protein
MVLIARGALVCMSVLAGKGAESGLSVASARRHPQRLGASDTRHRSDAAATGRGSRSGQERHSRGQRGHLRVPLRTPRRAATCPTSRASSRSAPEVVECIGEARPTRRGPRWSRSPQGDELVHAQSGEGGDEEDRGIKRRRRGADQGVDLLDRVHVDVRPTRGALALDVADRVLSQPPDFARAQRSSSSVERFAADRAPASVATRPRPARTSPPCAPSPARCRRAPGRAARRGPLGRSGG